MQELLRPDPRSCAVLIYRGTGKARAGCYISLAVTIVSRKSQCVWLTGCSSSPGCCGLQDEVFCELSSGSE